MSLIQFIDEWLEHEEWWFDPGHKYDTLIKNKYGNILDISVSVCGEPPCVETLCAETPCVEPLCAETPFVETLCAETPCVEPLCAETLCALCIAYDQLPRHIYRNNNEIINNYLQKSLYFLKCIPDINVYKGWKLCFLLLPLRHTRILSNIEYILCIMWEKLKTDPKNSKIYKRFIKATYQSLPVTQDLVYSNGLSEYNIEQFRDILDFTGKLHETNSIYNQYITTEFQKNIKDDQEYIISISGGVDSMIASYLAVKLLSNVVCLHINYENRPTSNFESKFVEYWCSKINVPLYTRHIKEINRPRCMEYDLRETYEAYTKEVRYACYKEVSKLHWGSDQAHVILGHNKDDCFENILTNIRSCSKYDNLLGMNYISTISNIKFYRPFLDVKKANIIEFAQNFGISYLYDSTPKWSQRGKIRDHVVPTLNEWDPLCINSMFALAHHMNDLTTIADKYIKHLISKITKKEESDAFLYSFSCDLMDIDKYVLRGIFKELNIPQPSKKSMDSLYNKINNNNNNISFNLSKCLHIKITRAKTDNILIYLYKSLL